MHDFIKAPSSTTLLELLGMADELAPAGSPSDVCAACTKPFTRTRKLRGHLRVTPSELLIPFILRYPLCGACVHRLRQGKLQQDRILTSVQKFMEGGTSQ